MCRVSGTVCGYKVLGVCGGYAYDGEVLGMWVSAVCGEVLGMCVGDIRCWVCV